MDYPRKAVCKSRGVIAHHDTPSYPVSVKVSFIHRLFTLRLSAQSTPYRQRHGLDERPRLEEGENLARLVHEAADDQAAGTGAGQIPPAMAGTIKSHDVLGRVCAALRALDDVIQIQARWASAKWVFASAIGTRLDHRP